MTAGSCALWWCLLSQFRTRWIISDVEHHIAATGDLVLHKEKSKKNTVCAAKDNNFILNLTTFR